MPTTLPLIITDVGRQAIVDATNTGTLPIVLSDVALGTDIWTPDATATAVSSASPKWISTVGGTAVSGDTLHVTITDDSSDAYDLGEFGLYTNTGVLFAIYSPGTGAQPITAKATDALLLIAADVVLTSVPPGSVTVNGVGFSNPAATETLAGITEIATQAEVDDGADDSRIVTPQKLATTMTNALAGKVTKTGDTMTGRLTIDHSEPGQNAVRIFRHVNQLDSPAALLLALDADAHDDIAIEVRGHGDATLVDTTENTQTSPDMKLQIWSNGDVNTVGTITVSGNEVTAFPAGTVMLFDQTTAPTGWTKLTDHNNKALRVVSGTASSGGSLSFTTVFANRTTSSTTAGGAIGSTTLTKTQMPAHSHTYDRAKARDAAYVGGYKFGYATDSEYQQWNDSGAIDNTGGGGSHNHSFSGNSHNHTLDMRVQYVDVIRAQKN